MCFSVILVTSLVFLIPVEANFYIEYTSNLYQQYYGADLRTDLFDCGMDPKSDDPKDMLPRIVCYLVTDSKQQNEIYRTNNFFIVRDAKLLNQEIYFVDFNDYFLFGNIYLAVSYEPLDYPDFLPPEVNANQNEEGIPGVLVNDENYKMSVFINLTNLKVFQDNPGQMLPSFRTYVEKLRKTKNYYWRTVHYDDRCRRFFRIWRPTAQEAQCFETFKKAEATVAKLLTKMIDPCFVSSLVNSGTKSIRMSEKEANLYCTTYCQALAVFPMLLRSKQVVEQCKELRIGKCVGNRCMCDVSEPTKRHFRSFNSDSSSTQRQKPISMAECNNRLVTLLSGDNIRRFTTPSTGHFPEKSSWIWGWEAFDEYAQQIVVTYGLGRGRFKHPRDSKAQEYWVDNKQSPAGRRVKFVRRPPEIIPDFNLDQCPSP